MRALTPAPGLFPILALQTAAQADNSITLR